MTTTTTPTPETTSHARIAAIIGSASQICTPTPDTGTAAAAPLYGFSQANQWGDPAWFHTPAAALRFAEACGWTTEDDTDGPQRKLTLADVEQTDEARAEDIMDTPENPWRTEQYEPLPEAVELARLLSADTSPEGLAAVLSGYIRVRQDRDAKTIARLEAELADCRATFDALAVKSRAMEFERNALKNSLESIAVQPMANNWSREIARAALGRGAE